MTEDQKKKLLEGFRKADDDDEIEDDWTEEEILEAGKRIIRRLGINGERSNEDPGRSDRLF